MKPEPHAAEHQASSARSADRIRSRPHDLRGLLRWAWATYKLEPPARLHESKLMGEDGDPKMTGEAERWLAMSGKDEEPDDWRRVACRIVDGCYISPMRCAIEATPDERDRMILRAAVVNVLSPEGICDLFDINPGDYDAVIFDKLNRLYTRYMDRPLPKRGPKSESQSIAESEDAA